MKKTYVKVLSCLLGMALMLSFAPAAAKAETGTGAAATATVQPLEEQSGAITESEITDGGETVSSKFSTVLTDGKLVLNAVPSKAMAEAIALDFRMMYHNPEFTLSNFSSDFSNCVITMNEGRADEEIHTVEIVWNYDENIKAIADDIVSKFSKDKKERFYLSDLEGINYWLHCTINNTYMNLASYSSELKTYLNNNSFSIFMREGGAYKFFTLRVEPAKLMHNGTAYAAFEKFCVKFENIIYVPENTGDTPDELIAAAQKRMDDYIGKDKVKITLSSDTVKTYYESRLVDYDNEIEEYKKRLAEENAKPESERDASVISSCTYSIERNSKFKQDFIDQFKEGGDGDERFLMKAAGGYIFNVYYENDPYYHEYVIVKDDTKLPVPPYATVDTNTGIQVTSSSTKILPDTTVEVIKLTEGSEEYNKIASILKVENCESFDIKLHSASLNQYVTQLENAQFEVQIPIPDKLKDKTLIVYYIDEQSNVIEHPVTIKNGLAAFITDHFSIYTLAEKPASAGDNTASGDSPQTGDTINVQLWAALAFISAAGLFILVIRRRENLR